ASPPDAPSAPARAQRVGLVEQRLEPGMGAAEAVDHGPGPVEVFAAALERPALRRGRDQVAQVGDLVRELHQPRILRQYGGALHLRALALLLRQRLVIAAGLDAG